MPDINTSGTESAEWVDRTLNDAKSLKGPAMHELMIEAGHAEKNYWRDLWRYRELFYVLAWRDISVRYKQTAIGWLILYCGSSVHALRRVVYLRRILSGGDPPTAGRHSGIKPRALNVFTLGPHARRSALVFAKVNSHGPKVGVIGWVPEEYKREPWWRSSDRSRELLEETFGYVYEVLFNSGRHPNSPAETASTDLRVVGSRLNVWKFTISPTKFQKSILDIRNYEPVGNM